MEVFQRSQRPLPTINVGPGEWKPWAWIGNRPTAVVGCPMCGKVMTVGLAIHTIHPDGRLSPSLVCPFKPCLFHVMARLEDWNGGDPAL